MAIPKFVDFMLPALEAMEDKYEHSVSEVSETISQKLGFTADEKSLTMPNNKKIYVRRTQWALCELCAAGLLERTRKTIFKITDIGMKTLANKPQEINQKFLMQFHAYNEQNKTAPNIAIENCQDTPEEAIFSAFKELNRSLMQDILDLIKKCNPSFFEKLVVDLLLGMGYGGSGKDAGKVVGKSGDGGIDGIIDQDKLGLDKIYIQAKRWQGNVGSKELNSFVGSLAGFHADKGVFITTSDFTKDAYEYISKAGKNVILINGQKLVELMIEHNIGVSEHERFVMKKIDHDYFNDEEY